METQRPELDPLRQTGGDAPREVVEHVFARGLVVDLHDVGKLPGESLAQGPVARRGAQNKGVVEPRDDLLADDAFQKAEIHHHAALGVGGLGGGTPLYRNEKSVGVAVYLAARTVVAVERVGRFEREFFGQSDCCHRAKIRISEGKSKLACFAEREYLRRSQCTNKPSGMPNLFEHSRGGSI